MRTLAFFFALLPMALLRPALSVAAEPAKLSADEQAAGWKLLFDGVTPKGWRGLGSEEFPAGWKIEDGCLKCLGDRKLASDLTTVDEYENFQLAFEWRFPGKKGNSGVKYRVQEEKGKTYAFGPEYQCFTDGDKIDQHSTGSLYDLIAPQDHKLVAADEFNQGMIVVQGNRTEHWLNGVKVVTAEFGSEELKTLLAKSYFRNSTWGQRPRGRIVLQDHHTQVYFRNIRILEMAAENERRSANP
ncbi:3-keto-disaccharide hydrolase [Anatilimnocola floriformis]|uniref:3-keto-disaccharide hydrolase n=1 Tax=Anatilimnocola floriformis TaxID=2948575 RepID=UPI0020C4EEEE|nr:DUF1080 domain-containing protein [Anatilimnocola floriformis]